MNSLFDSLPTWAIGLGLFLACCLASELGGLRRRRLPSPGETIYATSAAVSLLALMIGFTFSVALNRYEARRELVVEEAAALTSLWERVQFQPAAERAAMSAIVRDYTDQRLRYFQQGTPTDRRRAADHAANALQERLWTTARQLSAGPNPPLVTRMLVEGLTRVDDASWRRESIGREHIPLLVIDLLALFAIVTAASLGYTGAAHRLVSRRTNIAFFLLVASSIFLVLDLDRPRTGVVLVSQQPMLELQARLAAIAL